MLHYAKVMQALQSVQEELFADYTHNITLARESWQRLVADPLVAQKIAHCSSPWLVPSWQGSLDTVHIVPLLQERSDCVVPMPDILMAVSSCASSV